MYNITFYVPKDHLEQVKNALFNAGAGRIGQYSHCAWQVLGEGQFMPLSGSDPTIGELHQIETVVEYKVEMVCEESIIQEVVSALKKAHPYETAAYSIIRCEAF